MKAGGARASGDAIEKLKSCTMQKNQNGDVHVKRHKIHIRSVIIDVKV